MKVERRPLNHLVSIVEEILTFARLEAGREVMSLSVVSAEAIAQQAVDVVRPLAAKKSLDLSVNMPPEDIMLRIDEVRVRRAHRPAANLRAVRAVGRRFPSPLRHDHLPVRGVTQMYGPVGSTPGLSPRGTPAGLGPSDLM